MVRPGGPWAAYLVARPELAELVAADLVAELADQAARPGAAGRAPRTPTPTRGRKNRPGCKLRRPLPDFTRYVSRETVLAPTLKKGPLCQPSQLVSKYLQIQNETDLQ